MFAVASVVGATEASAVAADVAAVSDTAPVCRFLGAGPLAQGADERDRPRFDAHQGTSKANQQGRVAAAVHFPTRLQLYSPLSEIIP